MTVDYVNPPFLREHPMFTSIVSIPRTGTLHLFSGTCAVDPSGNVVGEGDLLAQFRYIMALLDQKLAVVGATWHDVALRRLYTTDVPKCLEAERDPDVLRYLDPEKKPASTLLGVTRLARPEFLIEVEIVAVTEPGMAPVDNA